MDLPAIVRSQRRGQRRREGRPNIYVCNQRTYSILLSEEKRRFVCVSADCHQDIDTNVSISNDWKQLNALCELNFIIALF